MSTRNLLPLATVSQRFHAVILRILHERLLLAASLEEQKLIFECYHPSAQYTSPHLDCDYLGTDGLSDVAAGEGSIYQDAKFSGWLGKLAGIYSHFRPRRPNLRRKVYTPHPAGDVPGDSNSSTMYPAAPTADLADSSSSQLQADAGVELYSETVTLDSNELFSQLCTATHLVRDSRRRGLFESFVTCSEGTTRIWRHWLAQQSAVTHSDDERVIWIDQSKNFGMRVKVTEKNWRKDQPILYQSEEEVAKSYSMDIEELLIRTTHLLLMAEESARTKDNTSGKAIVFGAFA
ncbi:MAG: hypothetical protein M1833_004575 [Piccolia ochrophora]|nr:MAG: hypothetical protein M1833_004575 [Piccolia ochrophora]